MKMPCRLLPSMVRLTLLAYVWSMIDQYLGDRIPVLASIRDGKTALIWKKYSI